jgi:hypothetical protein
MELKGKVIIKKFAIGSKSEHDAIYLETEEGDFVLRQMGANPFNDPGLKKMVGKRVKAEGTIKDYLFLATTIEVVAEGKKK